MTDDRIKELFDEHASDHPLEIGLWTGFLRAMSLSQFTAALRAALAEERERRPWKCHVCGAATRCACADCQIDLHATVYVCEKKECQDEHARKCPAELGKELAEAVRLLGPMALIGCNVHQSWPDFAYVLEKYSSKQGFVVDRLAHTTVGDCRAAAALVAEHGGEAPKGD